MKKNILFLIIIFTYLNITVFQNKNLQAQNKNLEQPKYTISFDLNGGQALELMPQILESNSYITKPIPPTKAGYSFSSWTTNSGKTWYFEYDKTPARNMVLYANWTKVHTVKFDSNGILSKQIPNQTLLQNYLILEPKDTTSTKYSTLSWNTKKDGTGTSWDFKNNRITSDLILYAQKSNKEYVLHYYLNNRPLNTSELAILKANENTLNTNLQIENLYSYKVKYSEPLTNPTNISTTKTGYVFQNWNTNTTGTGIQQRPGIDKMPASNLVLYAKYSKNLYTVKFNSNVANYETIINSGTQKVYYNDTIPFNVATSRRGYRFVGWNESKDGTGLYYQIDKTKITKNLTLHAIWKRI